MEETDTRKVEEVTEPPEDDETVEEEEDDTFDLDPLDLAILGVLPEEGTRLGKYLLDTRNVRQIARDLDDKYVTPTVIGRRFGDLRKHGYVVGRKRGSNAATAWQRTKLGTATVNEAEAGSENGQ